MLLYTELRTDSYHLMVRTTADQQTYARAIYKELGFMDETDKWKDGFARYTSGHA